MDEEVVLPRITVPLDLGRNYTLFLCSLHQNWAGFTTEQFIAALQATTTLTDLCVGCGGDYKSTPENNRRIIEPLCRCIANLRRHNPNHPLRTLDIQSVCYNIADQGLLLEAAKQFGIHHIKLRFMGVSIQYLEEFCRDNTHLKVLDMESVTCLDKDECPVSVPWPDVPQDSLSAVLVALDVLTMKWVRFTDVTAATEFSNLIARVTSRTLELGGMHIGDADVDEYEQNTRMRVVSELIKQTLQQVTLIDGCRIEVMDAIEACATLTQIQLIENYPPTDFRPAAVQEKLLSIVTRNRELARFVANPRGYPDGKLLTLMRQFDNCPTGRYVLARCFPAIPSFFEDQEH